MDRARLAEALAALAEGNDPVLVKLDEIKAQLERLQAGTRLLSLEQFCEAHPAFKLVTLRRYVAEREQNGLAAAGAVTKWEGILVIDERAMLAAIKRGSLKPKRPAPRRRGRPRKAVA